MILDFEFLILDSPRHVQAGAERSAAPGTSRTHHHQTRIQNPKSKFLFFFKIILLLIVAVPVFAQRQAQLPWWDRAEERWIGPYWIKSDLPSDQVNAFAKRLNVMHREFGKAVGHVPVRVQDKLNVLIFASRDEWAFTLRTRYAINPPEEGGWFSSPVDHFLAFWIEGVAPRSIEQIMQREGFRQYAHNRFGEDLPLWLNEGLAELFGEAMLFGDSLVFGQYTEREILQLHDDIANEKYIPFQTMLDINAEEWAEAQNVHSRATPSRQSRAMALFVLMNHAETFTRLMQHLNNGLSAPYAIGRTLGTDVDGLEHRWAEFVLARRPGALATARERIEFLAEGALELSRRKISPQSLNELKAALREIKFSRTVKGRLEETTHSADDESLYQIPKDELCVQQPVFVAGKSRQPPTRREQALERDNPTPTAISTQHLRPMGVQVKWVRDAENKSFTYQVVIR